MEKFRNLTNNIFFKIFLGFLGITFVTFGVGDFIMNSSNSWVAKVDDKKIAYTDFLQTMQKNREMIYRSNPDERVLNYLNSDKFKEDTVNTMVVKSLIDKMQSYLGIYPDNDLVLQNITSHPRFLDENKNFSRVGFINYLKINGISEESFVSDVSRDVVSEIVVNSLQYDSIKNPKLAAILYKHRKQKRKADVITVSTKNISGLSNPSDAELEQFFQSQKDRFIVPEFRKVSYIEFSKSDIMPKVKVSDKDVLEYYNNSSVYVIPATKDFYHLLFEDEIEAGKFLNALIEDINVSGNKKKSFVKLAKKFQDRKKEDILLDNLTKEDLLPEISEDVFAVKLGDYSNVLKSSLGYHIFYFAKQNPESKEKLTSAVRKEIKENIIEERSEELFVQRMDLVDDTILANNSLSAVAKDFGLKIKTTVKFDQNGLNKAGKNLKVSLSGFVKNSFVLPIDEASELFFSKPDQKYYAVLVNEIEDSRERELKEVKAKVRALFIESEKKRKLMSFASDLKSKIESGQVSFNSAILNNRLKLQKNKIFQRSYQIDVGGRKLDYSNNFSKDLFDTEVGSFTNPHFVSENEVNIGLVKKVIDPESNKKNINKFAQELVEEFKESIVVDYDNYLQSLFPIEINSALIRNNDDSNF